MTQIKRIRATGVYVLPEVKIPLTSEDLTKLKPMYREFCKKSFGEIITDKEIEVTVNIFPWGMYLGKDLVALATKLDTLTSKRPSMIGQDEWLLKMICILYPSKYKPL